MTEVVCVLLVLLLPCGLLVLGSMALDKIKARLMARRRAREQEIHEVERAKRLEQLEQELREIEEDEGIIDL